MSRRAAYSCIHTVSAGRSETAADVMRYEMTATTHAGAALPEVLSAGRTDEVCDREVCAGGLLSADQDMTEVILIFKKENKPLHSL